MKIYEVRVASEASKALKKLDKKAARRVVAALEILETNPRPNGVKKLMARHGWRIRVGDYRIIYTIDDGILLVSIVRIAHRREVYRK